MLVEGMKAGVLVLFSAACIGVAAGSQGKPVSGEAPAAVRSAVESYFGTGAVYRPQRIVLDGATCYTVTGSMDGSPVTLILAPTGQLQQVSRPMTWDSLPTAVQRTLRSSYKGAEFGMIESMELRLFNLNVTQDGTERQVQIFAAGNCWKPDTATERDEQETMHPMHGSGWDESDN